MSGFEAGFLVLAFLGASLSAAYWQIQRAMREESTRDRLIREAHERAAAAREWDAIALAWDLPAYDGPDLDAGLERLRRAVRDEQQNQKGD